ncbi:MAG: hypothetical protein IJV32_07790 [Bacteroidales bacterium]|nr:hypothetical protein [Bacteroidales bacterium]
MKRLILATLAGLFLMTSCNLGEDVYTVTNLSEFVTVKGETMVDDYGNLFNVTEDKTDKGWKTDDKRLLAQFDIVNRNLDITLKAYKNVTIQTPELYTPSEDEEPMDPVAIQDASITAKGYLNIILSYYAKPETDCPHDITLGYNKEGTVLNFYLMHEGNGENPAKMSEDLLKEYYRIYSFPIAGLLESDDLMDIFLQCDVLASDNDGNYSVVRKNARLYSGNVVF